jgi:predicted phage terminase large subunit-like protein
VLGRNPKWEIIAASGAQNLALSFSRYGRDLIQDPAYGAIFPDTVLDPSSKSVENWNLKGGGGYLSAGIGTMITGRGATVLIIDDPVRDGEAADSATIRDNVWEWYMSTAYTRLAPGGGVLGVLTWWNEDDWAGRIQQVMATGDGDKFEIVRYPAINDVGDEYLLPDDSIEQFPEGSLVPQGSKLLRPLGTALHPQRFPAQELLKKKANYCALGQKRWWDALFQQNPTPEDGDYFTPEMFRYYSSAPDIRELYIYQAWDFAITEGQKKDYTVGTTVGVDFRGAVYVLDVMRFRSGDGIHISNTIVDYARQWQPAAVGVEDGQIWKAIESQFLRSCEEARYFPSYEVLKPLTDKFARASPLKGQMQAGRVYFDKNAHWFTELFKEFLRFGAGGIHDDIVDSLSWCIRLTLMRSAPKDPREKHKVKLKSWKDKLKGFGLEGGSHMSA